MMKYERKILDYLVDKYERSKSFIGDNKKQQNFSVKITKLFPNYDDEAEYELFHGLEQSVAELLSKDFITVAKKKNGLTDTITLKLENINGIYQFLSRTPKADTNAQLIEILTKFANNNALLREYCKTQIERMSLNRKVEYFDGDYREYENILKAISSIFDVNEETYIRDFSIRVLGDSKTFESIQNKVKRLLFQYGDFPNEDSILEDLNIIKNPGHVFVKGNAIIHLNGQTLDLSKLNGDIAISSTLLPSIDKINVLGNKVITIENLTTFNSFKDDDTFAIYLGGYHNSHRREFIKKIYNTNPDKDYYHYGDIDAGGFYILLHLRQKTGIYFLPYHMGINELQQYSQYTKHLSETDVKRLMRLKNSEFSDTVTYMIDNNCKLEQEAMDQ